MKRLKIEFYIDVDDETEEGKDFIQEIKESVDAKELNEEFDEPFLRNPVATFEISDVE